MHRCPGHALPTEYACTLLSSSLPLPNMPRALNAHATTGMHVHALRGTPTYSQKPSHFPPPPEDDAHTHLWVLLLLPLPFPLHELAVKLLQLQLVSRHARGALDAALPLLLLVAALLPLLLRAAGAAAVGGG